MAPSEITLLKLHGSVGWRTRDERHLAFDGDFLQSLLSDYVAEVIQDTDAATQKIIVSVKGGENVSVSMIRDLAHVVERERAKLGLFITHAKAADPMTKEALKEGYFETSTGGKYLKLQIATIDQVLTSTGPDLPSPDSTQFPKAAQKHRSPLRSIWPALLSLRALEILLPHQNRTDHEVPDTLKDLTAVPLRRSSSAR
jgi:hypothetical protein